MASLSGKVFIVTEGAYGMGLATAKMLFSRGAFLGLCDLSPSLSKVVESFPAEHKGRVLSEHVDITNHSALKSFFKETKKRFSKIEGIANIASTGGHKLGNDEVWETDDQEFDFIMNVNMRGLFNVLSEALQPGVLEKPGSIVHITSMLSARG